MKYNKEEIKNLEYERLVEILSNLTPDEIIELSNQVGYPVFTRLCMGDLKHKFVLLQDGAAVVIINSKGQILLQSRADKNKWGLPGGCQELGERFEDTAIREIKEETNLDILEANLELIGIISGNSRKNEYPNGDIVINNTVLYLVRKYSGELKWNEESNKMQFFDLDKLPENLHDADLIEAYKNYIRKNVAKLSTEEKSMSVMKDYNDIALEYCDEFCGTQVYNKFIDKWLQTIKKGNILDVGCGGGNNCQYINEKDGFKTYGIDFSEGMVFEAQRRYPNIEIEKMDMTNMTFPNQTFDGILSNCSLIHIPTELIPQTIQGFKRVLKANGKLLLIVLEGNGEEMVEEPYRQGKDVYAYTKYFTIDEITKILNDNGFKVDEIEKRKTESENELAGGELVVYASSESIIENKNL